MTKSLLLATTAILFSGGVALAQAPAGGPAPTAASAATPDPAGTGVLVFTPDFFAEQQPNTALDMVNRVPGFSVDDGSGSRGFEGSVGNVLINGARPASKNDTGSNVLSRTTASQVERIELIRGGSPGIDMQGYSVVANVILKSESSRQHILTTYASLYDGGQDLFGANYQFTASEGDRSWGLTLSDGIGSSDSNGTGRVVRTDANGAVLRDESIYTDGYGGGDSIRGNYSGPLAGGKIDLTARYGINDWHGQQLQTSAVARRESFDNEDSDNGEFGVVYTRPLSERWKLETRFIHQFRSFSGTSSYRQSLNGVDSPDKVFGYDGNTSETILRGLLRFERSPRLTFETGGELAYNMLEIDQAFTVGGVAVPLPSASVTVEETRGEAFGKATFRLNHQLTLEGGLRLEGSTISQSGDADQEKSLFFAKPRFLATWTPMENNQFRFRFERELGQLDFSDFAASADLNNGNVFGGNVDLEPEQRWISELTWERRFWEEGIVSVGLRHDEIIDVLDVIPLPGGLSATGNIGDGTLDQLAVSATIPTTKLGLSGGLFTVSNTWNHTEVTDPTTGETRPISRVRPSQVVIEFRQDITSLKAQWGFNFLPAFDQPTYDPDQKRTFLLRDYFEAWAEYKPTASLSIRAQVNIWNDSTFEQIVYADRTTRAIAYVDRQLIDPRTFFQIRVRKTF
ncbi:TonB-dependent receptor [uncultured Brevundimonas sp.]|uniref:TonB-dependent receptor plug domain-containing protein n=1 Tax=uncultured Brevundimonas sp. TaxID=213418 RepID=UPI0030ECC2E6|tara:strand:- start:48155 stop:50209 length:2055 start_codon:yes stop_codon:yes gene_type:complete